VNRDLLNRLEAGGVWLVYHFFRLLPLDAASAVGGWLGRTVGPRLAMTRRAYANLRLALPDLTAVEHDGIVNRMWDNLGRNIGEYPHIKDFRLGPGERVEIEGLEHAESMRDDGAPGLFFSAHFGNWELLGPLAAKVRIVLHLVYRAPNNPRVEWIFRVSRDNAGIELIPKGAAGARRLVELLRGGQHVAMLVDQKMNDGIAAPFFGLDAMTAPALAALALKYDCPVLPARVVRVRGARFRVIVEPPYKFARSEDRKADVLAAMIQVNGTVERWIRERPDHWLWLHRRWPKG
jgi:KDO2-lipid IV(A) lauroyltransferase